MLSTHQHRCVAHLALTSLRGVAQSCSHCLSRRFLLSPEQTLGCACVSQQRLLASHWQ